MAKSSLIGRIAVDLVANTGKLLAPLKRAEAGVATFAAKTRAMGAAMLRIAAPVTALVGSYLTAAYAIRKLTTAMGEIDSISKMSDRLGITTERLIGLQHAAGFAGVETDKLNKALTGMMKRGFRIEYLEDLADKLTQLRDPMERLQFAIAHFGEAGRDMITMLQGGSEGLRKAQADAEKLGLAFSRIDGAKVEIANDAISRIGLSISGISRRIAIELAPYLKWFADSLVQIGTDGEGMAGKVEGAFERITHGIGWALDALHELRLMFEGLKLGWQILGAWIVEGLAGVVKSIEWAAEGISTAFAWTWLQVEKGFFALVGHMANKLGEFINWVESYLPAALQTGLGGSLQNIAKSYEEAFEIRKQAAEAGDYKVEFDLGADFMRETADSVWRGVGDAMRQFDQDLMADKPSERFAKNIAKIRADAQAAAESAIAPMSDIRLGDARAQATAMERGSQEAFKAVFETTQKTSLEQQQLDAQRKQLVVLERLERQGVVIYSAGLSGAL